MLTIPSVLLLAFLVGAVRAVLNRLTYGSVITTDGQYYLQAAAGRPTARPFCWRWGLPYWLGPTPLNWEVANGVLLLATPVLLAVLLLQWGFAPIQALAGVGLYVGLGGVFTLLSWAPILTDHAAHFLGIAIAILVGTGDPWLVGLAGVLAVIGACIHETVPVWAAIIAWSWCPLVGLVGLPICWWMRRGVALPRVDHHTFWQILRRGLPRVFNPRRMLVPWGVCLVALWSGDFQVYTAFGVGWASMLVASADQRLFQRGFPVVIAGTLMVLPEHAVLLGVLCLAQWFLVYFDPKPAPACPLPGL